MIDFEVVHLQKLLKTVFFDKIDLSPFLYFSLAKKKCYQNIFTFLIATKLFISFTHIPPLGCSNPPKMNRKLMFLSKCFHNHRANSWFCQDKSVKSELRKRFLPQLSTSFILNSGTELITIMKQICITVPWSLNYLYNVHTPWLLFTPVLFWCQVCRVSLEYNTFFQSAFQILWLKSTQVEIFSRQVNLFNYHVPRTSFPLQPICTQNGWTVTNLCIRVLFRLLFLRISI